MNRPCAIFDLDGTLIDSLTVIRSVIEEMLVERGSSRRIPPYAARRYASLGGRAMVAALLSGEAGDPDLDVADFRVRYASRPTPLDSIYHGVTEGLERLLAAGITLGVCSNKPQYLCEKVLEDVDLRPSFTSVVGARDGLPLKPHPALLDLLMRDLAVTASQCVYLGDSDLDEAIASAVKMPCVLVTYGYGDLSDVDVRIPRVSSFPQAVSLAESILKGQKTATRPDVWSPA